MLDTFDAPLRRESWAYRNLLGQDKRNQWTPVITFATPGNLNVVHSLQIGAWQRLGNLVQVWFSLTTSTFTHTTAAGSLRVTGLPFAVENVTNYFPMGPVAWTGITKANYTQVTCYGTPGQSYLTFSSSGSGQAVADVVAGDVPTAGGVQLYGSLVYQI